MADDPNALWNYDDTPSNTTGPSAIDYIWNFGKSAVESVPEMIGYTPSADTQKFRQDNPIAGVLSEATGMLVPYGGWLKGISMIPKAAKAIEAVGALSKSPFLSGALKAGAELAPLEFGLAGVSQIPGVGGDKPFDEMLGGAAVNTLAGAGIGGVLHGIMAAGTRGETLKNIFGKDSNIDASMPLPLLARSMTDIINSGKITDPEKLGTAKMKLNDVLFKARTEELPKGSNYVGELDPGTIPAGQPSKLVDQLTWLFKPTEGVTKGKNSVEIRKFAVGAEKDFPDQASWQAAVKEAGLPENFEQEGQYFRHISFNPEMPNADKRAYEINQRLTRQMTKVGDSSFMTREADDGMWIIAKKLNGSVVKPDDADSWLLFKTDKPGLFVPDGDRWQKGQIGAGKWVPGATLAEDGGDIYNTGKGYRKEMPLNNYQALLQASSGSIAGLVDKALPQNIRGAADNELIQRTGETFKEYLSPRVHQFKKSFRANWIVNGIKLLYDKAENTVSDFMDGAIKASPGKSLFFQFMSGSREAVSGFDPIRPMAEVTRKNWEQEFPLIWNARLDPTKLDALVADGKIAAETGAWWKNLHGASEKQLADVAKAETAVGRTPTQFPKNSYGQQRLWEGDTRVIIRNPADQIVALGSGVNRKSAQANAEALIKQNPGWRIDGEYSISQRAGEEGRPQYPKGMEPLLHAPSWMLEKQDIRGFKWDTKAPTAEEFMKDLEDSFRSRAKYQANLASADQFSVELNRLQLEDPSAYRAVVARMNDYAGVQSTWSRLQNRALDAVLAPALGTNSATTIANVTNTSLFNFQLGALKLAYPIVNALQFVQTVNPEVAFILGRAPDALKAGRYSFFAGGGTLGPSGGMAVLSPLKMMAHSVKEMINPSPELSEAMARAARERVVDPRIVEDHVGSARASVLNLKKAFSGGKDFGRWLQALSEWLPAESERLSRTHAFTTGYITGRDFLEKGGQKLNPEQIYQFAKQFTENTMYLYSAADKPRIFTTPAGSLMGLFKNWMFNYMHTMAEYTEGAVKHNDWAPLMWQTAGTVGLGGVSAVPGFFLADQATKWFTNKSAMDMAYEQWGAGGDGVMLGLPAALTGVSLYSGVSSPLANPTRDASQLFSSAVVDRVKLLSKSVGAAFDKWQATGQHPGFDPGVREQLIRAFAPTTVYRSMGALTPEQITQLGTGLPIVKNVPFMHRVLYGAGFNPTELDRGLAISEELYATKQKMQAQVKQLGDAWSDAEMKGDSRQMGMILRQSVVWGVDVSSVIHSGMRNLQKMRKDLVERQMSPRLLGKARAAIGVQESREIPGIGAETGEE